MNTTAPDREPREVPHGVAAAAGAVATVLAVLLGLPLGLGLGAAPAAAAVPTGSHRSAPFGPRLVDVELAGLTPATLTPGATFTVSGAVRNRGTVPLTGLEVEVRIRPERLPTRAAIRSWENGTDVDRTSQVVLTRTLPGRLAPGQRVTFSASGPVTARFGLPSGSASFGARAVSVVVTRAVASSGSARQAVGDRRTFTVWSPDRTPPTLRLGVLVPLVASSASPDVAAPDAQTLAELAPTGRIGRLTRVGTGTPGLTWFVDPGLLLAARRATEPDAGADGGTAVPTAAGDSPTSGDATTPTPGASAATGTSGAASGSDADAQLAAEALGAREWLDTLRGSTGRQDVWQLPFGDPDLAAVAHAGRTDLLAAALATGDAAARRVLGRPLPSTLAWPANGQADDATAELASGAGMTGLVLAGSALPGGTDAVRPTPDARVQVTTGRRRLGALVADDSLSTAFAGAGRAGGTVAQQRLVAELATVAREGYGGEARSLVVTAPRDWRVDATALSRTLATLRGTSWLALTPASALRAEPAARDAARLAYQASARVGELPRAGVRAIADARTRLARFAPALVDPEPVVGPLQRRSLSLVGVAWRSARQRFEARSAALGRDVDALYAGITVAEGSPKNLAAKTGDLPITVDNKLTVPVRVVVALRPRSGRLVVVRSKTVTVPAQARTAALLPVRAIADGDVDVEVSFRTPTGALIVDAGTIQVKVRSDWETRGIAVVGGSLVILLVAGLVRGVRRGRRPSVPLETVPDPDDVGRVLVDDQGNVLAEHGDDVGAGTGTGTDTGTDPGTGTDTDADGGDTDDGGGAALTRGPDTRPLDLPDASDASDLPAAAGPAAAPADPRPRVGTHHPRGTR